MCRDLSKRKKLFSLELLRRRQFIYFVTGLEVREVSK